MKNYLFTQLVLQNYNTLAILAIEQEITNNVESENITHKFSTIKVRRRSIKICLQIHRYNVFAYTIEIKLFLNEQNS